MRSLQLVFAFHLLLLCRGHVLGPFVRAQGSGRVFPLYILVDSLLLYVHAFHNAGMDAVYAFVSWKRRLAQQGFASFGVGLGCVWNGMLGLEPFLPSNVFV